MADRVEMTHPDIAEPMSCLSAAVDTWRASGWVPAEAPVEPEEPVEVEPGEPASRSRKPRAKKAASAARKGQEAS